MSEHDPYIERALELARAAAENGNEPFGSLLVRGDEIIAESENTVNTDDDVTAHPELKLARWAAAELPSHALAETTMYTSTEPCAMCSGAIYHSGLRRVVYSVSAERSREVAGNDLVVPSTDIFERGDADVDVVGPVLPEAGARVHEECWAMVPTDE